FKEPDDNLRTGVSNAGGGKISNQSFIAHVTRRNFLEYVQAARLDWIFGHNAASLIADDVFGQQGEFQRMGLVIRPQHNLLATPAKLRNRVQRGRQFADPLYSGK